MNNPAPSVENVEDGIEVGQDNLGMDPLDEENGIKGKGKRPGTSYRTETIFQFIITYIFYFPL